MGFKELLLDALAVGLDLSHVLLGLSRGQAAPGALSGRQRRRPGCLWVRACLLLPPRRQLSERC